jgi:hypothetical protein
MRYTNIIPLLSAQHRVVIRLKLHPTVAYCISAPNPCTVLAQTPAPTPHTQHQVAANNRCPQAKTAAVQTDCAPKNGMRDTPQYTHL